MIDDLLYKMKFLCRVGLHKWHVNYDWRGKPWFCERCEKEKE